MSHPAAGAPGQVSAAQLKRAFRHHVTQPGVRLRIRAVRGAFEADIPSASASHAGIHPLNNDDARREATRRLEASLSRSAGTPVTIRSVATLRGGRTVRVTLAPAGRGRAL